MNRLIWSLALTTAIAVLPGCTGFPPADSNSASEAQTATLATAAPFSYDPYAKVLQTYVNPQGLVNYKGLQADRQLLDTFNRSLGQVTPETYASWSESEQIAFLINAYNSLTLQSIIDQNPLKKSIRDIPGVWRWRRFEVAGKSRTLDEIEHKILRVDFNEPRIHAALVCAAISCPPLRPEPFTGENLNAQLDDQVRQWLAGPHGLKLDRQGNRVNISAIFQWFGEDWKKTYGVAGKFTGDDNQRAVLNFISNYLPSEDQTYLAQGQYQLGYLDYDWSLNIQP